MGNLVSSCGPQGPSSTNSSPKSNNTAKTNGKSNTPPTPPPSPSGNTPKANTPKATTPKANYTVPLKASKEGNININEPSPSEVKFKNTVSVKEMPRKRNLPTNNSVPENLKAMKLGAEKANPVASAMKPNTRTNKEKASGINPNQNTLINSVAKGIVKGAEVGKKTNKENINTLFSPEEEIVETERILAEMTNPPPTKPVFELGTKPAPERPAGLAGGRRTKKHRKQRKH